jgi:type II secretory pathway predicted ATPase ExeA
MSPQVLSELRLLASTRFDSRIILAVVLAGDGRLRDLLRRPELLSLGSRIRTRLALEVAPREQLLATLEHLLDAAGNRKLMTPELMHTLADHALGNLRVLTTMGAELLAAAAQHEITQLDEKLYLEVFAAAARPTPAPRRAAAGRRRA